MPTLTPPQAAAIAAGVYGLRDDTVSGLAGLGQALGCEGMFTANDNSRFEARSGALPFSKISGFGYVAMGTGSFAGEMLVATRGTAMGVDWLSNLNIGLQTGPGGLPVHAGFNEVWKSFSPALRTALRNRNPSRIHCVGHSLGGALANLNADMLTAGAVAPISLYTFGAPRTGGHFFARTLGRRVGEIHRVSNLADPVPMIPLFPFAHAGLGKAPLRVGASGRVAVANHVMKSGYNPFVAGMASWQALEAANATADTADVQSWLEAAADGKGSMLMGAASLLTMIGRALVWVLKKSGSVLAGGLGAGLTIGATVLDQIAFLLSTGAKLSVEIAGYVRTIIAAIFRFLGKTLAKGADLGMAFLRWVLDMLFTSLANVARGALNSLL